MDGKEVARLKAQVGRLETPRQKEIREKGFDITNYGKIKVGVKTLEDAALVLGNNFTSKATQPNLGRKSYILQQLNCGNIDKLREISRYFYKESGIYQRVCDYFATMYRYDWYIAPEVYGENSKTNQEVIIKDFKKALAYLDNSQIAKTCRTISKRVIVDGAYYGYLLDGKTSIILQELPAKYCRSRYIVGGLPAIEFNMRFFDDYFPITEYRLKVLKLFPKEFQKGYMLYKQNKLKSDTLEDTFNCGWYLLTPGSCIKFSINDNDMPFFISTIPYILDLDAAQDLDRRKQMQRLLKVLIQKLPLDKNGDLLFDVEEARDIHNNAVEMLSRAIGVDVLTTFADVDAIDMSDKNTATTSDDLERVERTVYNSTGVSRNLFNTEGNLALEKSILNDEGTVRDLYLQLRFFYDMITQTRSSSRKKYTFRLYMLETTQYNYKDLAKLYKEQCQMGFSKMLPQIALGHSQSSILNTIYFENEVLHLSEIMIPPLMSSTLSGADILTPKANRSGGSGNNTPDGSDNQTGRPEKEDSEKSEKTIANQESMS